eukprot:comp23154_c1_seq1/m.37440 comp23154_c1_seq1/g.37440  ORF comp23154_c1_seq1/g.37440 comp23154_c1_seq1/m.37440 type:complete len:953 (-) comp23154_c1_seq1:421-3279(-)
MEGKSENEGETLAKGSSSPISGRMRLQRHSLVKGLANEFLVKARENSLPPPRPIDNTTRGSLSAARTITPYDVKSQGQTFERYLATLFLVNTHSVLGDDVYLHGTFNGVKGAYGEPERMVPAPHFPPGWMCGKAKCEGPFEFVVRAGKDTIEVKPEDRFTVVAMMDSAFNITEQCRVIIVNKLHLGKTERAFRGELRTTKTLKETQAMAWAEVDDVDPDILNFKIRVAERKKEEARIDAERKEEEERLRREEERKARALELEAARARALQEEEEERKRAEESRRRREELIKAIAAETERREREEREERERREREERERVEREEKERREREERERLEGEEMERLEREEKERVERWEREDRERREREEKEERERLERVAKEEEDRKAREETERWEREEIEKWERQERERREREEAERREREREEREREEKEREGREQREKIAQETMEAMDRESEEEEKKRRELKEVSLRLEKEHIQQIEREKLEKIQREKEEKERREQEERERIGREAGERREKEEAMEREEREIREAEEMERREKERLEMEERNRTAMIAALVMREEKERILREEEERRKMAEETRRNLARSTILAVSGAENSTTKTPAADTICANVNQSEMASNTSDSSSQPEIPEYIGGEPDLHDHLSETSVEYFDTIEEEAEGAADEKKPSDSGQVPEPGRPTTSSSSGPFVIQQQQHGGTPNKTRRPLVMTAETAAWLAANPAVATGPSAPAVKPDVPVNMVVTGPPSHGSLTKSGAGAGVGVHRAVTSVSEELKTGGEYHQSMPSLRSQSDDHGVVQRSGSGNNSGVNGKKEKDRSKGGPLSYLARTVSQKKKVAALLQHQNSQPQMGKNTKHIAPATSGVSMVADSSANHYHHTQALTRNSSVKNQASARGKITNSAPVVFGNVSGRVTESPLKYMPPVSIIREGGVVTEAGMARKLPVEFLTASTDPRINKRIVVV